MTDDTALIAYVVLGVIAFVGIVLLIIAFAHSVVFMEPDR